MLVEKPKHQTTPTGSPSETTPQTSQQQRLDELVENYAARLRSVLSRTGRKPFRMAGLQLFADLLALLTSLDITLTHLPHEPRLTCFAQAIREALLDFEDDYITIAEGYSWVQDISLILDVPLPEPGQKEPDTPLSDTVKANLDLYFAQLDNRSDLNPTLIHFRAKLKALTSRYAPGLFHCYDIPGLQRTNNDLESLFGRLRRQTKLTSGDYHARQQLHERGAWLLFDLVDNQQSQLQRLKRVSTEQWRDERKRMNAHLASFTNNRQFRRNSTLYLAQLEMNAQLLATLF